MNKQTNDKTFGNTRMSFGDHLLELRSRLIKSIYGLIIGCAVAAFFTGDIITFLARPLMIALDVSGNKLELYAISPPEVFLTYIKVCIFSGIFISSPWIFYQMWGFIASGLYPNERRYVNLFVPFSALLFLLGGLFMIFIVAPISFNFFVTFAPRMHLPDISDSLVKKWFFASGEHDKTNAPNNIDQNVAPGTPPIEDSEKKEIPLIKPIYTLKNYISLVVILVMAFGLAFQMPLVVLMLGRLSIVKLETFTSTRKFIFLGIVIFSAMITPPDVISQIALSLPMYVLYEFGIIMLRLWPRRK